MPRFFTPTLLKYAMAPAASTDRCFVIRSKCHSGLDRFPVIAVSTSSHQFALVTAVVGDAEPLAVSALTAPAKEALAAPQP